MSLPLLFRTIALLSAVASLARVTCEETPLLFSGQDSPQSQEEDTFSIHYTCPGQGKPNAHSEAAVPRIPAAGASASFYIQVNTMKTKGAMKFTVFEDPRLRWSRQGKKADWVIQVGRRQKRLGSSKILPGNGMHSVTIVSSEKSVTILEDGHVVGSWNRKKQMISRAFEMQGCPDDAQLDVRVTGIQVHGDFSEAVFPET